MTVPIRIKVSRRHRLDPKAWAPVSRQAWEEAAAYWHEELAAKHFTDGARREYRYAARSLAHRRRKLRKFGHSLPLVYTGGLRRSVLRQRQVKVSPGRHRGARGGTAQIKLRVPNYTNPGRRAHYPDIPAELRAISNRDAQELARVVERVVTEQLNAPAPAQEV